MSFDHNRYNADFLEGNQAAIDRIENAKEEYGVQIEPVDVAEGETYWKLIGVHHYLPRENQGMHNVFIEVLDEAGQRPSDPIGWAGWTWEGKRPDERADPVPLDKPLAETAGNIAVFQGQKVSAWLNGLSRDAVDKSDRVENLHTMHPDEREPTGELWNSVGHHSFYVVFQRTLKEAAVPAEGVISGQIEHGRGYTVRLLRGNTVIAEQKVSDTLTYKFEGLPSGAYRVQAVGPTVDSDAVQLDTNNAQATVNLTAPQS